MSDFRDDLQQLINRHCMENGSDTPDFILAQYLRDSLAAFDSAVKWREKWYGRGPQPVIGEVTICSAQSEPKPDGIKP